MILPQQLLGLRALCRCVFCLVIGNKLLYITDPFNTYEGLFEK